MGPEEIKALRKELRCTTGELVESLGIDPKTVMAWENDKLFPTKRFITAMNALRDKGAGSVVRKRRSSRTASPYTLLRDPDLWAIVRKLLAHHDLREQVKKLADAYDEPET